ncbi:pilus assembly FimT family protein [Furfurilactobacillus entadae]|uniref:pilus assembly FimT family protein n=1 Tax=Furfurilactobacillus entadae TaxID=2922307 RepID=UPI0038B33F44
MKSRIMLRPKNRAGFTLIEMVVVLAVTTLMILWGTQAFAQTRQIQTERQFLTTTVALIEQGRAHAAQSNFLVKVSFTDAGVVYQEFDSHHTVRLAMPKSLRLPHGWADQLDGTGHDSAKRHCLCYNTRR